MLVSDPEPTLVPGVRVEGPTDTDRRRRQRDGRRRCWPWPPGAALPEAALVGNLVASITVQQLATTGTARPDEPARALDMWLSQRNDRSIGTITHEPRTVRAQTTWKTSRGILLKIDAGAVGTAIEWLRDARDADRTIYSCGNGGSALVASQMVCDIVKGASYRHAKRFKMIGLTDAVGTMLAYANDVNYDVIFVEQLKNFAVEGDVLIAISGSGNSPNILRAVEYANSIGCRTIGLTTGPAAGSRTWPNCRSWSPRATWAGWRTAFFILTHILCYAFIEETC